MTGWTEIRVWFQKTFPEIPESLRNDFQIETQSENAKRVMILGGIFIAISIAVLFLSLFPLAYDDSFNRKVYLIVNFSLLAFSGIVFAWGFYIEKGTWDLHPIVSKALLMFIALCIVLWAFWMTSTDPYGSNKGWFYLGTVFLVYSLMLFSFVEVVVFTSLIIIGQFLLQLLPIKGDTGGEGDNFHAISVAVLFIAAIMSRVLFFSRVRNFLNWENIFRMNITLKREVGMHMRTSEELEISRQELDKKVHRQTKHLREANQRLSEEIAERRYADKVRGILYRISTFVNGHRELDEVFEYIHAQLESVMEVRNFYIAKFDESDFGINGVFEISNSELESENSSIRSLCSYVIRQRKSILLDRKATIALAKKNEIEVPSVLAHSWLGVPLKVDNSILGVLVVKSYSGNLEYDQTDLELLEYVSEHMAQAMARMSSEQVLIAAKEKAEESDQLKSAFLANLSHEIRTPMNAIVGFAELIGDSDLNKKERAYYSDQVVANSNYLLKLISNIIELSKIQSGQILIRPVNNPIVKSLESLKSTYTKLAESLNKSDLFIDFNVDSEIAEESFSADPERFKQVMLCLVENALKFTNSGGVSISVQAFDRQRIQFSVSDTGIGMDEADTKKIFEWFRQGAKASQELYRGMGLGLTLAKLLIDVMGGTIWVETELGSGTCFLFTLPLVKEITTRDLPLEIKNPENQDHYRSRQSNAG